MWNRGEWADHENRVNVSKASGDSVDAVAVLPEGFTVGGVWGRYVAVGAGDGKVRVVKMGSNSVVATLAHSLTAEEAKVRAEGEGEGEGGYERAIEEGVAALGVDCEGRIVSGGGSVVRVWYWEDALEEGEGRKRGNDGSGSGEDSDGDGDSSSEEEREKRKKRKKKRKGGKGKAKSVGAKAVASFKGMD